MFMRLLCDGMLLDSTSQGSPGVEHVRWKRPVLAGDTLTGRNTVTAKREFAKRPTIGLVTCRHELRNQRGEVVLEVENTGMFLKVGSSLMATTLDEFFRIGQTIELGSHTFDAASIKAFAAKYDPQPFHLDEEAAKRSVFGGLSASGWHTASMWMKYNMQTKTDFIDPLARRRAGAPMSASPGLHNLKWLKPVYAGETIPLHPPRLGASPGPEPGPLATADGGGGWIRFPTGAKVIGFDTAVMVKVG